MPHLVRRRLLAPVAALCAVTASLVPAAAARPAAPAAAGRVCLFLAPDGVPLVGHVGWAVMTDDGR
ncbi:hypothetical protein [Streptomyces sp. NPDC053069]|uniref:hypothetical protein n=1 Tax=Streptomyces sp. NPDC053069 TaxID=3365695 RepID=UPI0037D5177A